MTDSSVHCNRMPFAVKGMHIWHILPAPRLILDHPGVECTLININQVSVSILNDIAQNQCKFSTRLIVALYQAILVSCETLSGPNFMIRVEAGEGRPRQLDSLIFQN